MPSGRFAPTPSGDLHLGNLRTALVAWLRARSLGGAFLVRLEDLDRGSVRPWFYGRQLDQLRAIGIDWDGPVLRQSERLDLYRAAIATLTEGGHIYPCYCTRREVLEAAVAPNGGLPPGGYPGTCRTLTSRQRAAFEAEGRRPALRVRAAGTRIGFDDRFCGWFDGTVDDFVVQRNDGTPAYNLAVVVDDVDQAVHEVVRGDDLLDSTPRQIHLARLLGLEPPEYAHIPLVLGPDGSRLAKRHGAVTLDDLQTLGASPAAVRGRLAESLGLVEPGEVGHDLDLDVLVRRFTFPRLPRRPLVLRSVAHAGQASSDRQGE
ncbi:MAG: tRNA glutamyl-Q(34) synthetase GluQRS [Acidimicrobiales bacterium]|nr:tRNA glutamyl-Q(34) synthetase GluQRS [Acidimicrobiales bacterium]